MSSVAMALLNTMFSLRVNTLFNIRKKRSKLALRRDGPGEKIPALGGWGDRNGCDGNVAA